ncbi:MAG: hypothetical protein ACFFDH_21065 [Promethearchaeota archaeon]
MEFEYEPYHIGSKIKFYVPKESLILKLQDHYEKNYMDFQVVPIVFNRDSVLAPVITLLSNDEDKVFIQLNLSGNALNVIGAKPDKVYNSFENMLNSLTEVGFDLNSTFSFYEIISNIILFLDNNIKPKTIFENITTQKFSQLNDISNIMVNHIKLSNQFTLGEDVERFEMEIYPNLTNPERSIKLRILNRYIDYRKIKKFHYNMEDFIDEIYRKLVGE